MERRRRVCGRSATAPFPSSQSQCRRERGGRRAASPSPSLSPSRPRSASSSTRRGRERRWERDGPRGESPRIRRGRERRLERGGARSTTSSPRRGRERRWERDGTRGEMRRTRRGCERRLESGGASSASTSPRRGRGRHQERDGPRDASPITRHGRNRCRERNAPRTISTASHRGSARRAERDGPRGAELSGARPTTQRPRTAPPSSRRGQDFYSENWGTRSTSPTSDRGSAFQQELEGPQPRPSTICSHKRRRQEHVGSAPLTSHSRELLATLASAQLQSIDEGCLDEESKCNKIGQDGVAMVSLEAENAMLPSAQLPSSDEESKCDKISQDGAAVVSLDAENAMLPSARLPSSDEKSKCDKDGLDEAVMVTLDAENDLLPSSQLPCIDEESKYVKNGQDDAAMVSLDAGNDLLGEIILRLHPTELTKMICGQRIHRLISRTMNPTMPKLLSPFLGALVQRGKSQHLVTLFDTKLLREIRSSVAFLRGSLKQLTHDIDIIDSRQGLMTLCFGKEEKNLYIWNPFLRKTWILLPCFKMQKDQVIGGVLLTQSSFDFSVLLLCVDKSVKGFSFPLVLRKFESSTRTWKRIVLSLHLKAGDTVLRHGICCNNLVYFLCKQRRFILKVDPSELTIDVIPLPLQVSSSQMCLTRVGEHLCFASADNRQILVFQYANNQWVHFWSRQTPSEAYWTKIVGSAEENGIVIVETGSDQVHALRVQDGSWMRLQQENVGTWCTGFEMTSPFRYPFMQPVFHLEETMPECVRYGTLKEIQ